MAFQNAFDASQCLVTVKQDASILFQAPLDKGGSSTFDDPEHAGETLTISVDANGVADLSGTFAGYSADFKSHYYVTVAPADSFSASRLSDIALAGTAGATLQISSYADGSVVDALTEASPYCTPNPYDFAGSPSDFGCHLWIGG